MEIARWQNCTWIDLVGEKDVLVVLNGGRAISLDGRTFSPGVLRAIVPVHSETEEDVRLHGGVFSFPCMKEVSADNMCWK